MLVFKQLFAFFKVRCSIASLSNHFFLAGFDTHGVLNLDVTTWLDGARPQVPLHPISLIGQLSLLENEFAEV
jgi:hypothetical protein